jgi:hypothetical protein
MTAPAQRGLADAVRSGDDDDARAGADRSQQRLRRPVVRCAVIQENGIGGQTEWLFRQAIKRLVRE